MSQQRRQASGGGARAEPVFPTKGEGASEGTPPARHGGRGPRSTRRSSRRNSVHKCPRTAPRGRSRRSVYTPLSPRLSTTAHLTERRTLHSPLDRGETKKRILLQRLTKNRSLVSPGVVECAFPSRRGAREVWGNPPARLRGTMENGSTGQMRSSNPPPGCGAGCASVRKSRFGV